MVGYLTQLLSLIKMICLNEVSILGLPMLSVVKNSCFLATFLLTFALLDKSQLTRKPLGQWLKIAFFATFLLTFAFLDKSQVTRKPHVFPLIHRSDHLSCPRAPPLPQSTAKCVHSGQNKLQAGCVNASAQKISSMKPQLCRCSWCCAVKHHHKHKVTSCCFFYLFDNLSIDNIQTLKDERWFKEYDSDVIATESVAITI